MRERMERGIVRFKFHVLNMALCDLESDSVTGHCLMCLYAFIVYMYNFEITQYAYMLYIHIYFIYI